MNNNAVSFRFSVRNIMKIVALLMLVFVFCPLFLVSCSGQTESIGLFDVIGGIEYYGDEVVKPHFELIICILLPIAILAVLFLKDKFDAKKSSIAVTALSAIDFIVLLIFRGGVKDFCEENAFQFKSTGWLKFDFFLHVLMIAAGALCIANILHLDADVSEIAGSEEVQRSLRQAGDSVTKFGGDAIRKGGNLVNDIGGKIGKSDDVICRCYKCGKSIRHGQTACASCGTAVPADILREAEADYAQRMAELERQKQEAEAKRQAEAEARRQAEEQRRAEIQARQDAAKAAAARAASPRFCQNCGARLVEGAKFCESCGTPVEVENK